MKKHSFFLILVSLLAFASCDKIEENNYVVYSGASGEWFDGNGVADHTQRAIIEKYTGVRCMNCPTAEDAINNAVSQYNGKLLAVAIHDSSTAFTRPYNGSPDLRTATGNAWSNFFGVFAAAQYPMALVNRTQVSGSWDLFNPVSGINSHVDPIVNSPATIAIQVEAGTQASSPAKSGTQASSPAKQSLITTTVNIEFLESVGDALNLTLFIIEDGINATQLMPDGSRNEDYIHNHVFRQVITDLWGAQVDCTGAKGEKRMAQFTAEADLNLITDLTKCHIVAMISNRETRQIINVAECEIK